MLPQRVALEVDARALLRAAERGHGERRRDQRDGEGPAAHRGDGDARAVDGDEALLDERLADGLRRGDRHPRLVPAALDLADDADPVDVAGELVAADLVPDAQGALEVHLVARPERSERRPADR